VSWLARALLFSGRPDPVWELSADDVRAIETAWSGLPLGEGRAVAPSRLGYHGVEVTADDGRTWVATGGLVTLDDGGEAATRVDAARSVERLVLATAPDDLLPPGAGPTT
jgi:hypothetical protein